MATTYVALLRAINLAGTNKVGMADLRALAEKLGLEEPRTLLQSGNLVFRAEGQTPAKLEALLEGALKKKLGVETPFFVRTAAQWAAIVAANPFPDEARRDPGHLVVVCLGDAPDRAAVAALQAAIKANNGREVVKTHGREAYLVYPDGIGRSKLTALLIEKKLGTRGTARNWNTVLKLAAMVGT